MRLYDPRRPVKFSNGEGYQSFEHFFHVRLTPYVFICVAVILSLSVVPGVMGYEYWKEAINYSWFNDENPASWHPTWDLDQLKDESKYTASAVNLANDYVKVWLNVTYWNETYGYPNQYLVRLYFENVTQTENDPESYYSVNGSIDYGMSDIERSLYCRNDTFKDCTFWLRSSGTSGPEHKFEACHREQNGNQDCDGILFSNTSNPNNYVNANCTTGDGNPGGSTCHMVYDVEVWFGYSGAERFSCNVNNLGSEYCMGTNGQYVYTCVENFGKYEFDEDVELCDYGCYLGECLVPNVTCVDLCVDGQRSCFEDGVVHCTNDTISGCWEWNGSIGEFCEYGCNGGFCIQNMSTCEYGNMTCSGNYLMNCTADSRDFWTYSELEFCDYGCEYNYSERIVQCNTVNDAHLVANSMGDLVVLVGFVFEPIAAVGWIVFSLFLSVILSVKSRDSMTGVYMLMGMVFLGTYPLGVLPIYFTGIVLLLSIAFIFRRRIND